MRILFVGAKPDLMNKHPGGQSTAAVGLLQYCSDNNIQLDVIDSAQESFPYPPIHKRIFRATVRIFLCCEKLIKNSYSGVIIFSSAGFSFYEKSLICILCRIFFTPSLLFVRSGFFMKESEGRVKRVVNSALLKAPNYVGSQGSNWSRFYERLNVSPARINTVPNWLSPGKTPRAMPVSNATLTNDVRILFVGWLVVAKGALDLLEAVEGSELLQKQRVSFIGDGEERSEIERRVTRGKLDKIELMGWKSAEEVEREMWASDIFVLPSHAEGFPNVIVEALAAGLPIVSTDVGAISDSVKNNINGTLVRVGDTKELARALEELILDSDRRERYASNSALVFLDRHELNKNCKQLVQVFCRDY